MSAAQHERSRPCTPPGCGRRNRRGFTLVEVLVAVGAVALVAVGMAAIFDSVGKTVTGGRRVSALTAYATILEQQMRRDFDAMTRDGFLVIRQQYTNDGTRQLRVPAHADDLAPRVRRIDEVVFFAQGDYSTARPPLAPSEAVRSKFARVYYGHGTRRVDLDRPVLYDDNSGAGRPGDPLGPNAFAADWLLARHVTVLANPESSRRFRAPVFGINPSTSAGAWRLSDKECQLAVQPAASSIFRTHARVVPDPTDVNGPRDYLRWDGFAPAFASGLVDVATMDLSEIRSFVTSSTQNPDSFTTGSTVLTPSGAFNAGGLAFQQAWMAQAFPAPSDAYARATSLEPFMGSRLRIENDAPDYIGVLGDDTLTDLQRSSLRADQLAMTASALLPRCTEFVVEWSFGDVVTDTSSRSLDSLLWYGLREDRTGDGELESSRYDTSLQTHATSFATLGGSTGTHQTSEALLYGPAAIDPDAPLTTFFGYVDPTFNPDRDGDPDGDGNNLNDPADAASRTLAWPWPKLIRVTVTLADARDPTIEQTFQFVFKVPEPAGL